MSRLVCVALALSALAVSSPVRAATFPCTEEGVLEAAGVGGGPHTFACAGATTIVTSDTVSIETDVILDGEGQLTLDGAGSHTVVRVAADRSVELRGLTVTAGLGFECAGGIVNAGTLVLERVVVTDHDGAGICNYGAQLELRDSEVSRNANFMDSGGGIAGGRVALFDSRVSGNLTIFEGGGVFADEVTLERSTVAGNSADGDGGGGIWAGEVTATGSTISGNFACVFCNDFAGRRRGLGGGGVSAGAATLVDSTVSGNRVFNGVGAAIAADTLDAAHTTFTGNPDDLGAGVFVVSARLANVVIDGTCDSPAISAGGNVESPGDSCGLSDPTDRAGTSAEALALGPLDENGGATRTHVLLPGSVAIDAAVEAACTPRDQRGVPRPQGAACDSGAVEVELARIRVEVDIKPGSAPSPINTHSRGVIPVAVLGSERFDVRSIDRSTLAFGPGAAPPAHRKGGHPRDVNRDGILDLLSHYRTQASGISPGDMAACVTGETRDGRPFEGCDVLVTVPACGLGFELAFFVPWLAWRRSRRALGPRA